MSVISSWNLENLTAKRSVAGSTGKPAQESPLLSSDEPPPPHRFVATALILGCEGLAHSRINETVGLVGIHDDIQPGIARPSWTFDVWQAFVGLPSPLELIPDRLRRPPFRLTSYQFSPSNAAPSAVRSRKYPKIRPFPSLHAVPLLFLKTRVTNPPSFLP